jgi:ABC-type antimicrobial peptide transport system ATPase subunit
MIRVNQKYGGKIIELCPQFSTFEGHLFVFAFRKKLLAQILREIGIDDKKDAIVFFMRERSSDQDVQSAISEGRILFVSTSEIRGPAQEQLNHRENST